LPILTAGCQPFKRVPVVYRVNEIYWEQNMRTKDITLFATAIALVMSTSIASADKGDKIENRLDRKGDRIDQR